MASANDNAPALLREEILADARQQAQAIVNRARQQAETLVATAQAEAAKTRQERLEAARAEAARRQELALSTVPVEAGRLRSAQMEVLLQAIHDEAGRQLLARAGMDYRETMIGLVVAALRGMVGDAIVVKVAPADRAGLAEEIAKRVGRNVSVIEDPGVSAGVVVQDAEGRQVWDNQLTARLERLWPELRQQIAVQTGLVAGGGGS